MLIDYNMSKDYCSDWTAIDAIREMVQNAIDSGCDYECKAEQGYITVITKDKQLPLDTLMLGQSVKSTGATGKYGEGYKIGMLVLSREGLSPSITTNGYNITGCFSNNQFDIETFKLQISNFSPCPNITFKCQWDGINLDELRAKLPAFTGKNPDLPRNVNIWHNRPGEIFVNGLYVTKEDLVFGYNFAPSQIKLNRDRNMVDGVHWQLARYFSELGAKHPEVIFNLIERDAPDVRDLSYHLYDDKLKAELARLFYNKYGDGAKIAKPGNVYYCPGSINVSSSASRVYSKCGIQEAKKIEDPDAPDQVLSAWLEQNRSKLRRDVRNSLDTVITRSKGWRKADIF